GDGPGIQLWRASGVSLQRAEAFVPIQYSSLDPSVVYLNVAVNFNGDGVYAPYNGTAGVQQEWVVVNTPIHVISGTPHYHSVFFALTDAAAQSGTCGADIWITNSALGSVSPGAGTSYSGSIVVSSFERDFFGPPSTLGPSGPGGGGPVNSLQQQDAAPGLDDP